MRKTIIKFLTNTGFILKTYAQRLFLEHRRRPPEQVRLAGLPLPHRHKSDYVTKNAPACCRSQRPGDMRVNGSWLAVHSVPREPAFRLFRKRE